MKPTTFPVARRGRLAAFAAVAMLAWSTPVIAADTVSLEELPPELRQLLNAILTQPQVSPGVVFGSPVGFGAGAGSYFFGLNGSTLEDGNDFVGGIEADGSLVIGAGVGDPLKAVGLELALNIVSLTDDFAEDGSLALKVHRRIGKRGSLAVGTENHSRLSWGAVEDHVRATTSTEFISYSHYFDLDASGDPRGLMLTVGVGDGRLGTADDPEDFAPFVSLGYNVTRQFSVIGDYAGESFNLGVSWVPWRQLPVSIVLGATDLAEERGSTEFAFAIGYTGQF